MVLLVGRKTGRADLLEAVGDRLRSHRPDLFAANLLVNDLHRRARGAFAATGLSPAALYARLRELGFGKTLQAARGYVAEDGPMAPREFRDLVRLDEALAMGMGERLLRETFAGVQRLRVFRRAAGRALATAARSAAGYRSTGIDPETGLSVADLREAILEARVGDVREVDAPVPASELGRLRANG
jgi:hypothetical protein